ncbi:hypothetical protein NDU88_001004 [Pleurodeles waltl]|uniref:Uncharacterized protein n=1 Tax=Pleurodeles waltl TaxID=8319 RepID=A0AAV7P9X8_PLEWA|nr:hypothetical protein NDU88_001004 [Pleurodeles waltl]
MCPIGPANSSKRDAPRLIPLATKWCLTHASKCLRVPLSPGELADTPPITQRCCHLAPSATMKMLTPSEACRSRMVRFSPSPEEAHSAGEVTVPCPAVGGRAHVFGCQRGVGDLLCSTLECEDPGAAQRTA